MGNNKKIFYPFSQTKSRLKKKPFPVSPLETRPLDIYPHISQRPEITDKVFKQTTEEMNQAAPTHRNSSSSSQTQYIFLNGRFNIKGKDSVKHLQSGSAACQTAAYQTANKNRDQKYSSTLLKTSHLSSHALPLLLQSFWVFWEKKSKCKVWSKRKCQQFLDQFLLISSQMIKH